MLFRRTLFTLVLLSIVASLVACEREGPMERAGEKADKAVENTKDKVEDATE